MTNPSQPAFSVQATSTQSNITADGTNQVVVFGTEIFDQGNDFASNTFTAPVDGKYPLSVLLDIRGLDTASTNIKVEITTSNRGYLFYFAPPVLSADPDFWAIAFSVLADMDTSDTALVNIAFQAAGGNQADLQDTTTKFSGFLAN